MSATRTPSFSLSLHALLTFPIRLCNPPPAASSVRSCKVTPLIKVSLDDVLNKRHLPPLTLKDFEEWLVFVEGSPQYLYFILWLKEYESRYAAWLAEYGYSYAHPFPAASLSTTSLVSPSTPPSPASLPSPSSLTPPSLASSAKSLSKPLSNSMLSLKNGGIGQCPMPPLSPSSPHLNYIPPSPSLALFFTRAKKTFFAMDGAGPRAPYTLFIPSGVCASAWRQTATGETGLTFSAHPHPHPKELAHVAAYARSVLKVSLEQFAVSACHNVGSRRAWCGIILGSLLTLVTGVLPTLLALFMAPSRWWRLLGFLGCWMGGGVVLSSLHGICMMIYLFGDLRQLRSFELARPAISGPRAIARARPRLRSFFTKTDDVIVEEGTESGSDGTEASDGNHIKNTGSTKKSKSSPEPNSNATTANINANVNANANALSNTNTTTLLSQTSTGTPIVRLGFQTQLDTISEKPSHTSFCSSASVSPEESKSSQTNMNNINDDATAPTLIPAPNPKSTLLTPPPSAAAASSLSNTDSDSDLGIVVSPTYYEHNTQGMWQSRGAGTGTGTASRIGTGSRFGMVMSRNGNGTASKTGTISTVGSAVMRWMMKSGSGGGTKASPGAGAEMEKTHSHYRTFSRGQGQDSQQQQQLSQSHSQVQSQPAYAHSQPQQQTRPPSAAGTFGIRSWIGGRTEAITPTSCRESLSVNYDDGCGCADDGECGGEFGTYMIGTNEHHCMRIRENHGVDSENMLGVGTMMSGHSTGMMSMQNGAAMMSTQGHGRGHGHTNTNATIDSFFPPAIVRDRDSYLPTIPDEEHFYHPAGSNSVTHHAPTPSQAVTAAFITRDYEPEMLASLDAPVLPLSASNAYIHNHPTPAANPIPSSPTQPGIQMHLCPQATSDYQAPHTEYPHMRPTPPPVKFDFDGLPAMISSPTLSAPVRAVLPHSPAPTMPLTPLPGSTVLPILPPATPAPPTPGTQIPRPRTRPAPLILVPPTPPASHIHTTLVLPSASTKSSPNLNASVIPIPPPKPKRSMLWWDTCPRHPAVEAKLAAASNAGIEGISDDNTPILPMGDQTPSLTSSPTSPNTHSRGGPFSAHTIPFFSKTKTAPPSPSKTHPYASQPTPTLRTHTQSIKKRLRSVTSVPAFGPLTRVLEPVVSRGQWEIVVRSAVYALFGAWVFVGVLVALPEGRRW